MKLKKIWCYYSITQNNLYNRQLVVILLEFLHFIAANYANEFLQLETCKWSHCWQDLTWCQRLCSGGRSALDERTNYQVLCEIKTFVWMPACSQSCLLNLVMFHGRLTLYQNRNLHLTNIKVFADNEWNEG